MTLLLCYSHNVRSPWSTSFLLRRTAHLELYCEPLHSIRGALVSRHGVILIRYVFQASAPLVHSSPTEEAHSNTQNHLHSVETSLPYNIQ